MSQGQVDAGSQQPGPQPQSEPPPAPRSSADPEALVRNAAVTLTQARMLVEEWHELHELVARQGTLLTGVVDAIRGREPLVLHSYHDAVELATALVAERDELRAELTARRELEMGSGG